MRYFFGIRWFFVVVTAIVVFSGCFVRNVPGPFDAAREKELDELISKRDDLKRAADICNQLGSFQGFKLVERGISRDGSELYFFFKSDKPFPEASRVFSDFFGEYGWVRLEQSRTAMHEFYMKEDLSVNIQYGGIRDAQFGLTCKKLGAQSR